MIASNIDGSSGNGSQLMDLLAVVAADPKGYQAKLKEIQDATAEHKKFVELVGPAAEILTIQKQIVLDKKNADQEVLDARAAAQKTIADANANAMDINAKAKATADEIISKVKLVEAETTTLNTKLKQDKKELNDATARANANSEMAKQKSAALDIQLAEAAQAKIEADAEKAAILAKHQEFIASL